METLGALCKTLLNSKLSGNWRLHEKGPEQTRVTMEANPNLISRGSRIENLNGNIHRIVHQIFVDFKKAYDLVTREVLYNILIEFGIPMKLVRLIKMYLNKTYSEVLIEFGIPMKLVRLIKTYLNKTYSGFRIGKHLIVFLSRMV
jgi:hypothetical protein